ncbi:MAG: deoxyribonuclease IV [Kiritimatiellae bacterium]|nr:deoxyribonuclease IV [Kiritimatiellia bacterium]
MSERHPNKFIGAHVSTAGGVENAPLNAAAIGAGAFALFVKPQRQWAAPPLEMGTVARFASNLAKSGIAARMALPHASYLINLASPQEEARMRSVESLAGEMAICRQLSLTMINVHPGSFLKEGTREEACARIADSIDRVLALVDGVDVVLENTAGQGSYLGSRFEELALVIGKVADSGRVGVCIDTAHAYGAGLDIATPGGFERVFEDFDRVVGFDRLRAMHLNDTAADCGSHVDRHAGLGRGTLGWSTFRRIMEDQRFDGMPLVLETPDPEKWAEEIRRLKEL